MNAEEAAALRKKLARFDQLRARYDSLKDRLDVTKHTAGMIVKFVDDHGHVILHVAASETQLVSKLVDTARKHLASELGDASREMAGL